MTRSLLLGSAAIAVTAVLAPLAFRPEPRLVWNPSASAPPGAYRVRPGAATAIGDYVVIRPPEPLARFATERGYIGRNATLLKHVAALPPSRVCREGGRVTVDGRTVATARERDRLGRPLPVWSGCRSLGAGELFALNAVPDSFDGRYFGVLPPDTVVGRAEPVWTRDGAR